MKTEGIYFDIPEQEYHADPCFTPSLSSGVARTLLQQSPLHAWWAHPRLNPAHEPFEANKAMDHGSAIHAMLLGKGAEIVCVEANDWRTNATKEARDLARAAGKTPILAKELRQINEAVAAARAQLLHHPEGRLLFEPGHAEATLLWNEAGIWCRARADWLLDDPAMPIIDIKTTSLSAAPGAWERRLVKEYAIQDAFYRRGLAHLRGRTPPMRFLVIEVEPPYGVAVMCAAPSLAAWADAEVERAIALWARCVRSDKWPGYSLHTAHIEAPPWVLTAQEEQRIRDEWDEDDAA